MLVFGVILILSPFILVFTFNDRLKGILVASTVSIAFIILVSILTQSVHIFGYLSVCSSYIILAVVAFVIFFKNKKTVKIRFPILFIVALAVVSFELISIHYHYTGYVETVKYEPLVVNDSYPYPLFSDEWTEASITNYSIKTHVLPTTNPLMVNELIPNLLIPFDSMLAGFFVLLGLSPISDFAILAIIFGILVSASVYVATRCWGIGKFSSAIVFLLIPYITNGANLPGIWFLLPYIASAVPFFIMLACLGKREYVLASIASFLSLILYPPFIVFIAPAFLIAVFLEYRNHRLEKSKALTYFAWPFAVASMCGLVFLLFGHDRSVTFSYIEHALFHRGLDLGIPSYGIWNVIPIITFPFIFIGCIDISSRRLFPCVALIVTGLSYWVLYAFYPDVIIIEYPRIVVITSLILLFVAGFGIDWLLSYFKQYMSFTYSSGAVLFVERVATILIGLIFIVASFWYPIGQEWKTFNIFENKGRGTIMIEPSQPLNRYLAPDDLAIWQGISGRNFTAPPWKGLVIGAATGNFPLETKPSTITVDIMPYESFISADCPSKDVLARRYLISYAYSSPFDCPNFSDLKESSEGLHLYKYIGS